MSMQELQELWRKLKAALVSTPMVLILVVALVGLLLLNRQQTETLREQTDTIETYKQTVTTLTVEIERITKELESSTNSSTEADVVETITEDKKAGTVVTKRRAKTKQAQTTITKATETKEATKSEQKQEVTEAKTVTKIIREQVTVKGPSRLGLDIGIGSGLSLDGKLNWNVDASYELKYRLAPRIGIELVPTFNKIQSIELGVELKL